MTKFKTKYGIKSDHSEESKLIKQEIEGMLNTNNMNVTALNELDKKIKAQIG